MKSSAIKNIVREIWGTKARFFSILAIIGLGVGFFAGVKAASPTMVQSMVDYASRQNIMDFRLMSTVGFDENDVEEIAKTEGVAFAQAGYFTDAVMNDSSKKSVVRIHSCSENDKINVPVLIEGRLPEKSGEIVVEDASFSNEIKIGSTIKFDRTVKSSQDGKEEDIPLEKTEFTVVGVVKSPLYISFQKGKTNVGNGTISYYMMILPEDFSSERYTELYLTSDYTEKGGYPFCDEYETEMSALQEKIEDVCDARIEKFDKDEIDPKRQELTDGKTELTDAEEKTNDELDNARSQILTLKTQYNTAVVPSGNKMMIAQMQAQLEGATLEYDINRVKAEAEFTKQESEIYYGEKELEQFDEIEAYVNDRNTLPGYEEFVDNAGRVDAVATVFPVFFLLVAVLVCVTTMTRMVEERRTEIGTFKALGYSNTAIVSKYVIYSTTAGLLGSAIGCVIGCASLPKIIFDAYKMMYNLNTMSIVIPWDIVIIGFVAAILCTSIVSWFTCRRELARRPASLMRPKTPKAGKRNLLERIGFLWKRMKFTSKVTARNLFRYKVRFLMTVVGVAGCTALILAAFGLLDSIGSIVDKQFGEINKYDLTIVFADSKTEEESNKFIYAVKEDYDIQNSMATYQEEITVYDNDAQEEYGDTYLVVPSNPDDFRNTVDLHTRIGKENIELADDGCVMSEKLASKLKLAIGDEFKIKDSDDNEVTIKLSAICENYLYNYIYISPAYYNNCFAKEIKYNMLCTNYIYDSESQKDALAEDLLEDSEVVSVSYSEAGIGNFKDMLNTLNLVVVVMIVFAGALAFVVLYNLTNINIAERTREIATIKVLGFFNREVSEYIYRENIILTIIGTAAGLLLGIVLNSFIIQTIEVDIVMFGRDILPLSFLYATGLTFLFALIVNFIMYFKMRKIDMVESLKSVE